MIASLIAGKTKDIGEPGGATGLFVRKPGSDQSWLVRSVFMPKPDPNDWLNKDVIGIDRARIQEAVITPSSGPAYIVRRDKPSDSDFTLAEMPKGRDAFLSTARRTASPRPLSASPSTRSRRHPSSTSPKPSRLVTKTFDGLIVTARCHQDGQ